MLLAALLLLLVAAGLLVASFVTANTLWAWGSIVASGLAAAVLVLRWIRLRRLRETPPGRHESESDDPDDLEVDGAPATAGVDDPDLGEAPGESAPVPAAVSDPSEEDTDAADLLIVRDLEDAVVVVDEHPRYHLAACTWLAHRPMELLPAREARELGFTPCALCGPDAALAQRYRGARSG